MSARRLKRRELQRTSGKPFEEVHFLNARKDFLAIAVVLPVVEPVRDMTRSLADLSPLAASMRAARAFLGGVTANALLRRVVGTVIARSGAGTVVIMNTVWTRQQSASISNAIRPGPKRSVNVLPRPRERNTRTPWPCVIRLGCPTRCRHEMSVE